MNKHKPFFMGILQKVFIVTCLLSCVWKCSAQQQRIDSLLLTFHHHPKDDTTKVKLLTDLAYCYTYVLPDSTITLCKQAYALASTLHYEYGKAKALTYWSIGSFLTSQAELAISQSKEALTIYQKINDKR